MEQMLSPVEVYQIEPVICLYDILPQLLVNDPPTLDKISPSAEYNIGLASIDTTDDKQVEVAVKATVAQEGCQWVDHCLVNTIEEPWSVK